MTGTDAPAPRMRWRLAGATLVGLAHGLTFSPSHSGTLQVLLFALAWGFVVGVGRVQPLTRPARAAAIGLAFGTGHFVSGIGWLYISMHYIGGLAAPLAAAAVLLLSLYLAAFGALAFALACRANLRGGAVAGVLTLAGAWTLGEWLRGVLFTGFPWLAAGYAHVDSLLAGLAPVLGVTGVTLAAVATAALIVTAIRAVTVRARALALATVVGLLIAGSLGSQAGWSNPATAPLRVRMLQGNVPQAMKFDPQRATRAMQEYIAAIDGEPVDLVVLPETAWIVPPSRTPPGLWRSLLDAAARVGPVALGAPVGVTPQQRALQPRTHLTNAVVTIDGEGRQLHRYDKRHLVPFGEFVPYGFQWFIDMMNIPLGNFARGDDDQPPLVINDARIAFNICYEDLFGPELRRQVTSGAQILVNVSNIGWFGRSHAVTQHLNISRMRAIELSRPVLRATNTGATASIDARGRVRALAPYHSVSTLETQVRGHSGLTPYARLGDWPALVAALAMTAVGLSMRGRTRPSPARSSPQV